MCCTQPLDKRLDYRLRDQSPSFDVSDVPIRFRLDSAGYFARPFVRPPARQHTLVVRTLLFESNFEFPASVRFKMTFCYDASFLGSFVHCSAGLRLPSGRMTAKHKSKCKCGEPKMNTRNRNVASASFCATRNRADVRNNGEILARAKAGTGSLRVSVLGSASFIRSMGKQNGVHPMRALK